MRVAPTIHESRLFGVASPAQAAAILLKGRELGFGAAASFEFINIIQGKPQLSPRGALAILHSSPEIEKIEIRELVDQSGVYLGHECYMKRRSGFEYTTRFTLADAQRAGLVKSGGGWEAYPKNMAMWRAVGFCADVVAPDLTAGATLLMKAPEQYGVALNAGGDIIEGQAQPVGAPEPIVLTDLVERYGPEAVMAANGGKIPATAAEVGEAARALGAVS